MREILHILIIFYSFEGFLLSLYLFLKKRSDEKIGCLFGGSCDEVIRSKYSRFLGIPVEALGLIYYLLTCVTNIILLLFPSFATSTASFILYSSSISAVFFSLYLTFIQTFTLRKFCTWCLASAFLCAIILATFIATSDFDFIPLLIIHHNAIVFFHIIGTIIGFGGAIVSDFMFFKFLKDFKISQFGSEVLDSMHEIIWFGVGIIVLSGIGLYLPDAENLLASPIFKMKMLVVGIIILNGALLTFVISPKLSTISFEDGKNPIQRSRLFRRLAFALGAVSSVSWNAAFIMGFVLTRTSDNKLNFVQLAAIYLLFLFGGIITSQLIEYLLARQAKNLQFSGENSPPQSLPSQNS